MDIHLQGDGMRFPLDVASARAPSIPPSWGTQTWGTTSLPLPGTLSAAWASSPQCVSHANPSQEPKGG